MGDRWRRIVVRGMTQLRSEGRAALAWSSRITVAAVASYVVGTLFFPGTQPLLAPLTAMLVVQVTPVSLLASGFDRVLAVVAGVTLAVGFAAVVPLEWWSLGLLILFSITIGQVLRLRANLIEVAISAMLVLGVGSFSAGSAAWQRIAETLVGAAVGVAANLLFPPKVASADAGRAIDGLADSLGALLTRAADELTEAAAGRRVVARDAADWLGEARRINHDIPQVGAALLHAEQSRRLNVRAVGRPDVGPGLRQGLEALEHSAVAIRGMFRALVDATNDAPWLDDEAAPDVVLALAQTFREVAAGVDAFGSLVRHEGDPSQRMSPADVQAVREGLEGLKEARARLEDLMTTRMAPEPQQLCGVVLETVGRLMREMDLDERIRRQFQLLRPARPRSPRAGSEGPRGTRPPDPPKRSPEPTPEAETQVLPRVDPDEPKGRRRRA